MSFRCFGPQKDNLVNYPSNYATLCTGVGIPPLLLKMHSPETLSFYDLREFAAFCGSWLAFCVLFFCAEFQMRCFPLFVTRLILIHVSASDFEYLRNGVLLQSSTE